MSNLFRDKIWNYKNFNMGTELDISGEFIYDGIQTLNQMTSVEEEALLFSFLYHVSVGIERLQKIVLTLIEEVALENCEDFEKSLITHSHTELSERITKVSQIKLNPRENEFLQLLTVFYKSARYHRFNTDSNRSNEQAMVTDFIEKHIRPDKFQTHFITDKCLITEDVKQLFGKVIGSISKKYYELIRTGCSQNNTFTYELRSGSKAEKIFLAQHRNNSLQEQKITEMIVLKEMLVYLRNTKESNSFIRFMEGIPPLDLDIALINEYFSDIVRGIVPQSLMDEVEYLYEQNGYSVDRMTHVDLVGNTNVLFEFSEITECIQMLDDLISGSCDSNEFAVKFPRKLELLEDECTHEILDSAIELCTCFLKNDISSDIFIKEIQSYYESIKTFYNY